MDEKELPGALRAAEIHSRRVRRELVNAESRGGEAERVVEAVTEHWRDHGETYKTVGRIVLEQLRLGLLTQLYGWREQLARQREAQRALRRTDASGTES